MNMSDFLMVMALIMCRVLIILKEMVRQKPQIRPYFMFSARRSMRNLKDGIFALTHPVGVSYLEAHLNSSHVFLFGL